VKALHQALGNTDDALAASLVPWTRETPERGTRELGELGWVILWSSTFYGIFMGYLWDIYGIYSGIYSDSLGFDMENL
jgi:hypothetical protein